MAEPFNAARARTRYALPMWVDAFDRDTRHLTAEQVGAYLLILHAMWTRESCDCPANDSILAAICRTSKTMWLRKIKPVLWPLMSEVDGVVFSKRLKKEAVFVEKYLQSQSDKKTGKFSDKPLKNNKTTQTGDMSGGDPGNIPTYKPSNLTKIDDDSARAREKPISLKARLAEAMGLDPEAATICDEAGMAEVKGWMKGYGLRSDEIVAVVAEVMAKRPDKSPPSSLTYFAKEMARLAEAKASKPEKPAPEKRAEAAPPATEDQIMRFYANWINSDRPIPPSTLKPNTARAMLDAGLVTPDQLRAKGIAY